jgi:pectin methylesterase-like acyl-CoA thioesterase
MKTDDSPCLRSSKGFARLPLVAGLSIGALVAACGGGSTDENASVDSGSAGADGASHTDGAGPSDAWSGASGDGAASGDGGASGDGDASGDGGKVAPSDATAAADAGAATDSSRADAAAVDAAARADASAGEGALPSGVLVFPAPNGAGICPDPPLRFTFSSPPTLGQAGKIQVFNAAQPATAVASVDMAATAFSDTIGGTTFNLTRPAYVDGNDAVIYLKSHALAYGQTYYVTVDGGAIVPPSGTLSVTGATTWRFSTKAAAPANLSSLAVALDGAGDFCSVQGAIDAIPAKNTTPAQITIASGIYHEIVHFSSKNNVTLLGQDRTGTVIEGTNNNNLNPSTATRSLVGIDGSSGVVLDTLTINNLTPQGGSQAEALRLESCDKCVVRNANVTSLQDTLLFGGRIYVDNCIIAGNVDFVWGTGAAYFNSCEIKTVVRQGAIVQARNPASTYGYVFVDSKLTADTGVTGQVLARIDVSAYPASHVAYINCQMGSFISPAGWTITGGTDTSQLRFWEYQSVDGAGQPIDVSRRIAGSTQISAAQAAQMRDPTVVLAGWQPP